MNNRRAKEMMGGGIVIMVLLLSCWDGSGLVSAFSTVPLLVRNTGRVHSTLGLLHNKHHRGSVFHRVSSSVEDTSIVRLDDGSTTDGKSPLSIISRYQMFRTLLTSLCPGQNMDLSTLKSHPTSIYIFAGQPILCTNSVARIPSKEPSWPPVWALFGLL